MKLRVWASKELIDGGHPAFVDYEAAAVLYRIDESGRLRLQCMSIEHDEPIEGRWSVYEKGHWLAIEEIQPVSEWVKSKLVDKKLV
jgi:hypothetical protein